MMKDTDKALIFNGTLLNLNNTIKKLKDIGLDMSEYEKARDNIMEELNVEIKKSYQFSSPSLKLGQEAILANNYMAATKKIDKLYENIKKYEIYSLAYSLTKVLQNFLEKNDKSEAEFNKLRNQIIKILSGLEHSNTLDYTKEKEIITDIYHVVYLFIKSEFTNLGVSPTLEYLQDNIYIDHEVRKELENINLKDPQYSYISGIKSNLDIKGLNSSYANADLIETLANSNLSFQEKVHISENLKIKLDLYLEKLQILKDNIHDMENNLEDCQNKCNKKGINTRIKSIILEIGLIISVLVASALFSKKISTSEETSYLTTSTIYDLLGDEEMETTTMSSKYDQDHLFLYKYFPWRQQDGKYIRTVWRYYIDEVGDLPIEDYLKLNLDKLKVNVEPFGEELEEGEVPSKLYDEYDYALEKIDVDKNTKENNTIFDKKKFWESNILMFTLINCFIAMICLADDLHYYPIIYNLIELKKELREIEKNKRDKVTYEQELKKLADELINLIADNKDILIKMEKILPQIINNSEYQDYANDINVTLKRIKNLINN